MRTKRMSSPPFLVVAVVVGCITAVIVVADIYFRTIEKERENLVSFVRQTQEIIVRTASLSEGLKAQIEHKNARIEKLKEEVSYFSRKLKEKELELANSMRFHRELLNQINKLKEDNRRLNNLLAARKDYENSSASPMPDTASAGASSVNSGNSPVILSQSEGKGAVKGGSDKSEGSVNIAAVENKSNELQSELEKKNKVVSSLEEQLKRISGEYDKLKDEYAGLKNTVEEQGRELADRADRIVRLQDKLAQTEAEHKEAQKKIGEYLKELATLRESYVEVKLDNLHLREELERSRQKLLSFKGEIDAVKDINNQLRLQIEKLVSVVGKGSDTPEKKVEVKLEKVDTGVK